jgi:hypothetical protein
MKNIIIIFLILIIIYLLTQNEKDDNKIKILLRQASRWAVASKQDNNLIIKVLHSNYAAGYLWALNDIYTTSQIEKSARIDYQKFRDEIINIQDEASKQLINKCSNYNIDNSYLAKIGSEG